MAHSVLIVDDDVELRTLLSRVFARAGFTVSEARDGAEGLQLALAGRPDLVVTDIVMPRQDGLGLVAGLRAQWPAARIIAMSGGGAPRGCHLTAARALGAAEVLRKPFSPGEIVVAARRLLEAGGAGYALAPLDDAQPAPG
jgi:two-component system, chemotaxis family, chemotaxis protein CheY